MRNELTEVKIYLQLLPTAQRLFEINLMIPDLINDNYPGTNINRKYSTIKQLKKLKEDILIEEQYTL